MAEGLEVRLRQARPIPLAVELECAPGELHALVGPSGSGKTTILRSVAGLYRPHQGRIRCGGSEWLDTDRGLDVAPQQRRVGLLFQHYALFPHLSAVGNVCAALGHLPPAERAGRARELLARVNLGGIGARRPAQLSGGEQQRVALARALAREPQALLLDEPFSAVDHVTRRKLRLELVELTRALSIPIVLVTHDLEEAGMLAQRMSILHNGATLQAGEPGAVMQRPASALVARLIDTRNIFEAVVGEPEGAERRGRIVWHDRALAVADCAGFAPGERVTWCIPPAQVLLHRRDRPSRGARENPVQGRVLEVLTVGGIATVLIAVDGLPDTRLHMDLPPHVLARSRLRIGDAVSMSLLAEAIHLMPWERLAPRRQREAGAGERAG